MKTWRDFLLGMYDDYINDLNSCANNLINMSSIKKDDLIVDAGAGIGLISTNILKNDSNANVIAIDNDNSCIEELNKLINTYPHFKILKNNLESIEIENNSINKIFDRSSLMHCKNKLIVLEEYYRVLKKNSQISMFVGIFYDTLDRYYKYLPINTKNYNFYKTVEEKVRNDNNDPLTNCNLDSWKKYLKEAGFKNIYIIQFPYFDYFKINNMLSDADIFYEDKPHAYSLKEKFLKYMTEEQFNIYYKTLEQNMIYKTLQHNIMGLYIFAQKEPDLFNYIKLKLKVLFFILLKQFPFIVKYTIKNPFIKLYYDIKCNSQKFIEVTLGYNPSK